MAQKMGHCTPCNASTNDALLDVTGQENTPPVAENPPIVARNLAAEIEEAAPVAFNPKAFETEVDEETGAVAKKCSSWHCKNPQKESS